MFDEATAHQRNNRAWYIVRLKRVRSHGWWTVAVTSLVVFVLLLWFDAARLGNVHTGDTDNLVVGTRRAGECIRAGTWTACGLLPGTRVSEVFPYPPLQYLPAGLFASLGLSNDAVVEALGRLNILAFAATIIMCGWAFHSPDRRASRSLAIIAVIGSSAVYQSTAGFGEMLAAAMATAAVAAVLRRRPVLIVATVAIAALGKDTLLPFIVALGFLCGRDEDRFLPPRRVWIPLLVGACLGGIVIVAFNVFRFGQVINVFYLDPLFRTPGEMRRLVFLAGEWLSPSAGLAWYWPIATAVLIACGWIAVIGLVRRPRRTRGWLPGLAVAGLAVLFTAGLASWFSPYGWIAYGPRLSVPLMPALTIAALHVAGSQLETAARVMLRPPAGFAVASALVIVAGWPQFGAAWSHTAAIADLIAADATCPRMTDYPIQADVARY